MMNVLTDILCDTSSTTPAHNFKGPLPHNESSHHDISSKQGHLQLFDSVSHMPGIDRPLSNVNHSSPDINIFHSSNQIHIPSNIDSGFEERSSVFSDAFPEIVPSWLAHDFMKVSDNLSSPGILSNVSDIYSTSRENEHLEMLDLGFPSELTTHDVVPNNLNRTCINDGQKMLPDLPLQRFSNSDSLMLPAFNNINNSHVSMSVNKNNMQYQKFKQNEHDMDSTGSLMNTVLPCENELLHLPLPSGLTAQCLNSTSSPSIISNSQSQSHSVDVSCDKLPQINLNHLESLLGNETPLSEIQLLRHDFPNSRLTADNCNPHSNQGCLENYSNRNVMSCVGNMLTSTLPPLPQSKDASVQVSFSNFSTNMLISENCFSCKEVTVESPIEIAQCFKCKFCDYISIHKCAISNHINTSHSKSANSNLDKNTHNESHNLNLISIQNKNEVHLQQNNILLNSNNVEANLNNMNSNSTLISERNVEKYSCLQCNQSYLNVYEYNSHMLSNHNKTNIIHLSEANNNSMNYLIPTNNIVLNTQPQKNNNGKENFVISNISNLLQIDNPKNFAAHSKMVNNMQNENQSKLLQNLPIDTNDSKAVITKKILKKTEPSKKLLKKSHSKRTDEAQVRNHAEKSVAEGASANNEKKLSAHKKAWQRKMNRELGSYICEFKGCNIRFRALDNLEYHRKCHSMGESPFACPECETTFENWGAIAGHLWRNHNNDMELHACDQCPFRTYSLSRLENLHKRIHKDECLFLCDTCGKSFKNGKQLRNHRVIHNKSKRNPKRSDIHKCNVCLKEFSSKALLHFHLNSVHNRIKPFVCNYCDYAAPKRSTMNLHMRQHTGEKPFKCDKCPYKTSDHNSLRRHKMRHSGEKPYKCPYCPYSCIQASLIKKHLEKHPGKGEGLILFSCNICKFKTLKQESYSSHMNEHESLDVQSRENSSMEMHSTDEIFPLAEAMDISLSQSDNLLSNFNKNKCLQSIFNGFNINVVYLGQENAT